MRNALLVVAAALITAGVALVYIPAGVFIAGVLLGAFVLFTD